MNWFGKNWGAPACYRDDHVPTPSGELCFHCDEPIEKSDNGFIGSFGEPPQAKLCPRSILGSVGHQNKTCSCFGGMDEDPVGMSKREAAKAAYQVYCKKLERI